MVFNLPIILGTITAPAASTSDEQDRDPILLAHRGLVRHAPENTAARFCRGYRVRFVD